MQEGTGYSLTPAAMGQMQARNVGVTAQEELGRATANYAAAMGGVVGAFEKMQDYKALTKANLDTRGIQSDMEADFGKRLQAAPGTALSFMNEDGTLNQDKVDSFAQDYKEKFAAVQPNFWDMTKRAEWEAERDDMVQNAMKRMTGQAQLHELNAIKRTGEAALNECELNDDAAGYAKEIRRQVDAGVLTEAEGRVKNLAFGKSKLKRAAGSGGRVRIGGAEYGGYAASLAAEAARTGYKPPTMSARRGGETDGGSDDDAWLNPVDSMLPMSLGESGRGVVETRKTQMETETSIKTDDGREIPITIYTEHEEPVVNEIDFGDEWLGGDFTGVVKSMSAQEMAQVQAEFEEPRITRTTDANGKEVFACPEHAPEAMKRLVAAANYNGELGKDGVKALVTSRAVGLLADDPELSAENILKQFDGKGVFEVLGDGSEEAGKTEAKIIVDGLKRLNAGNAGQLEKKAVDRAIELHVNRPTLGVRKDGSVEDWKAVERASTYLQPKGRKNGVAVYGKYEWPKDDAAKQKRWNDLKRAYKQHRAEWNAELADKEYSDEDFVKDAGAFTAWYMSKRYDNARTATQNAERDYYKGKVAERMQREIQVGEDGNVQVGGYVNQVNILKTTLEQDSPLSDDVKAYLKEEGMREKTAREQRGKLRAAGDLARRRLDNEASRQSEKAEALKAIDAQEKERNKREQAEERNRMKARRKMKRCETWGWDGTQDANVPECTVPQEEIERIKELGWDGEQDVYLLVDGQSSKRVRVKMEDGGNGDTKILMNHLGAIYLQPKKSGKVQRRAVTGDFQYNYDFQ